MFYDSGDVVPFTPTQSMAINGIMVLSTLNLQHVL